MHCRLFPRLLLYARQAGLRAGYTRRCATGKILSPRSIASDLKFSFSVVKLRVVPNVKKTSAVRSILTVADSQEVGKPSMDQEEHKEVQGQLHAILANSKSNEGWDKCWKIGVTPWDLASVTPIIQDLVNKGQLPDGRALVPGCGLGYDVLALASETRHVVGLDISPTVNSMSKQMAEANPQGAFVEFIAADFFEYKPEAPFNLIYDYTFFSALDHSVRSAWAAKIAQLLDSNGELITLMFPLGDFDGGPPFAVSVKAYEEVLSIHGLSIVSCVDNELAVGPRKGKEKLAYWRRSNSKI